MNWSARESATDEEGDMTTRHARISTILTIAATVTCRNSRLAQDGDNVPLEVRAAILSDLRSQVGSSVAKEVLQSTKISVDSSRAVPGVVYFWGSFRPPGSNDADFLSVVIWKDARATAVHSLIDWNRIVRPATQLGAESLLGLCEEGVRITGPMRNPTLAGSFVQSLSDLRPNSPALGDALFRSKFAPPKFEPNPSQPISVIAWMVWPLEGAWKLRCQLDSSNRRIEIEALDSVHAGGIPSRAKPKLGGG